MDYLSHLRHEFDAFAACLGGDLAAPVEHCGGWTLYDLANHLGRGTLWAVAAVREQRGDHRSPHAPKDPAELLAWFSSAADTLVRTLDTDPSAPAWTFFPPHTVAFWQRRRCHETLVHRFDAEHAVGVASVIDPALAGDGVAEVIDTMAPFQIQRERLAPLPHAIRLVATDVGSSWDLGPGEPVASVSGPAADLLLLLWKRRPADHPSIRWDGDRDAAAAVLAGPLVP